MKKYPNGTVRISLTLLSCPFVQHSALTTGSAGRSPTRIRFKTPSRNVAKLIPRVEIMSSPQSTQYVEPQYETPESPLLGEGVAARGSISVEEFRVRRF